MAQLRVTIGPHQFLARLEEERAPRTCAAFRGLLPFHNRIIQARWSGEAGWVPLGSMQLGLGVENATSYPSPGEILLYPGGFSETEILVPYGPTRFSSRLGQLAGNHFLTIVEGRDALSKLSRLLPWEGAQNISFEVID